MANATPSEVHTQTVAEISRWTGEIVRELQRKPDVRAALYASRQAGIPDYAPVPADELAATEFALQVMNGHAPDSLQLVPTQDPDHRLAVKVLGYDKCLAGCCPRKNWRPWKPTSALFGRKFAGIFS